MFERLRKAIWDSLPPFRGTISRECGRSKEKLIVDDELVAAYVTMANGDIDVMHYHHYERPIANSRRRGPKNRKNPDICRECEEAGLVACYWKYTVED